MSETEARFSLERENDCFSAVNASQEQHGPNAQGDSEGWVPSAESQSGEGRSARFGRERAALFPFADGGRMSQHAAPGGGHVYGIRGLESDPFLKCI